METTAVDSLPKNMYGGPSTAEHSNELGKEDFLALLVAQLEQQDPMNPMDSSAFVAQLAQFSSLEALVNLGGTMDGIALSQTSATNAQVVSFIGRQVEYDGDTMTWNAEQGEGAIRFTLGDAAATVDIAILDSEGHTLRDINLVNQEAGLRNIDFDGLANDGSDLPSGEYTVQVSAKNSDGDAVEVFTRAQAHVSAIDFDGGYPQLVLDNGQIVTLGQVLRIIEDPGSTAGESTPDQQPGT